MKYIIDDGTSIKNAYNPTFPRNDHIKKIDQLSVTTLEENHVKDWYQQSNNTSVREFLPVKNSIYTYNNPIILDQEIARIRYDSDSTGIKILEHNVCYQFPFDLCSKYKNNPLALSSLSLTTSKLQKIDGYNFNGDTFLVIDLECQLNMGKTIVNSVGYVVYKNLEKQIFREFFVDYEYAKKFNEHHTDGNIALSFLLYDILYYKPCIMGYNIKSFDIPVLKENYPEHPVCKLGLLDISFDIYLYILHQKDKYHIQHKKGDLKLSTLLDVHLQRNQYHRALDDCYDCWDIFIYFINEKNLINIQYKNQLNNHKQCGVTL